MWLNGSERCHDPFKWNKAYDKEASSVRISIKFILTLSSTEYNTLDLGQGLAASHVILSDVWTT